MNTAESAGEESDDELGRSGGGDSDGDNGDDVGWTRLLAPDGTTLVVPVIV